MTGPGPPGDGCGWCGGRCSGADPGPWLEPNLAWLWLALAEVADRRGDPDLTGGPGVRLTLPVEAAERSAAAGIVPVGRPGQVVRLDLGRLAGLVAARSPGLTPGAVAAHAARRPLAVRAAAAARRREGRDEVGEALRTACRAAPELAARADDVVEHLRAAGWVARLANRGLGAAELALQAVQIAVAVLRLPEGERYDRRLLVPDNPHALDEGSTLAGAVLAVLAAARRISSAPGAPARALWAQAGVDCDDLSGGLTMMGLTPVDWGLPAGTVCTVPPRELVRARWPAPGRAEAWVFVTENPSVLAAAADLSPRRTPSEPVRLICTMGTPSATEIEAVARIAAAGWRVAVRADFDPAGVRHVTALLGGVPGSSPWRMGGADFSASRPSAEAVGEVPPTPWDPDLRRRMTDAGKVAFEEALMDVLLDDLATGRPGP